jgi:hypothetical protein
MTNDTGTQSEPNPHDDARIGDAGSPVQDEPIMDGNDASIRAKWEGIITQTRADLGHHSVDEIRRALAQRVSDAQLAVPAGELDRMAREIATSTDGREHFDRTAAHDGE